MKKIFGTDIKDISSFERAGYVYNKIYENNKKHIVVWEMGDLDAPEKVYKNYEVWKGKKFKQPDGSICWIKPKDEDWGAYGWSYYGTWEFCREKIKKKLVDLGVREPEI